jgi:uncharacterized protein
MLSFFIKIYKVFISPFLGRNCRFYPSCADYFDEAVKQHGVIKGVYLGLLRICKCNPFFEGGIDEVPKCKGKK